MTTPRPKTLNGLVQKYVTKADRGMADWHLMLRRVTFGAAIVLMGASVVSLHYACALIGLPDSPYAPIAWIVPLAMETGMAAVASTATTIRKPVKPGDEGKPGRYYWSLWIIFSFVMLLAQAANVGHAAIVVSSRINTLPSFIPQDVVYTFACAFAALFPLGGTLLVHVSGFLRAHGTGAGWIEDDAEVVLVEATHSTQHVTARARATAPAVHKPAAAATPVSIPEPERAPAQAPRAEQSAPVEAARALEIDRQRVGGRHSNPEQEAARAIFDQMVAANPTSKPLANLVRESAGLEHRDKATVRRWVQNWWADLEVTRATGETPISAEPQQKRAVVNGFTPTLVRAEAAHGPATVTALPTPAPVTAVPVNTDTATVVPAAPVSPDDFTDEQLEALTRPENESVQP